MQNQATSVSRRLSDPDFQGLLVRTSLLVVVVESALLATFIAHDAYVWTHPVKPEYFFVDGHNPPVKAEALDSPVVDDTQVLQWSSKWMLAPYAVNYHDFPEQLNTAGAHYTQNGWRSFGVSYIKSGNFEKMQQARMLCYAQAQRSALIRQTLVTNGRLSYEVQLPILQTCQNVNQEVTRNYMLTATVIRVDINRNNRDGLAIEQLVASAY